MTHSTNRRKARRLRRKNNRHSFSFIQLEQKKLLAGDVFAGIFGDYLVVVGDNASNDIAINLDATIANEFIQGTRGTNIDFSRHFESRFSAESIENVIVRMNAGHDSVVVHGGQHQIGGNLRFELGAGNDALVAVGVGSQSIEIGQDLWIEGHNGSDSIFLSGIDIGDDLRYYGHRGSDTLAVENISVADRTAMFGLNSADNFLIADSQFATTSGILAGPGNDLLAESESNFGDRIRVHGERDFDYCFLRSENAGQQNVLQSVERVLTNLDYNVRPQLAFDRLSDWLFDKASTLTPEGADQIQNQLSVLATHFDLEFIQVELDSDSQTISVNDPTPSVSVLWDQAVQTAVEAEGPGPTIASRAYSMVHTAMYDAWSAYDVTAKSTQLEDSLQRPTSENTLANKQKAMSFAAYRVLEDLFANQTDIFDEVMSELGYDPTNDSSNTSTPAGIGNAMAEALLEFRHEDGSNQLGTDPDGDSGVPYSDTSGYQSRNEAGATAEIDLWTPEFVPINSGSNAQQFLTPHWGDVSSFSLDSGSQFRPVAPEPFLLVEGEVNLADKTITLSDGSIVDIDSSLIGTVINPEFIEQAEEVAEFSANLTDEQKLIAEFWEDGGGTSFPPGTFMTFGEFVSARDNHSIDQDAKMFFALSNAVFDAGIATWEAKVHYDYVRPVRAIRELGELGLIGEFDSDLGGYAIDAWVPDQGTQTILATDFLTYQTPGSDPSPPFSEYTSGHSSFSAAGATILKMFTGSDILDASVTFSTGSSRFESGTTPVDPVTLQWETFSAAADEAGLSRIYGGIHFEQGDLNGRSLGTSIGEAVWAKAQTYINGTA